MRQRTWLRLCASSIPEQLLAESSSHINRVAITLTQNNDIVAVSSDEPIEFYFVCPHVPHDRVYLYEGVKVGPQHVQADIGGYPVGHRNDGTFPDFQTGPTSPKLSPSRPHIGLAAQTPAGNRE